MELELQRAKKLHSSAVIRMKIGTEKKILMKMIKVVVMMKLIWIYQVKMMLIKNLGVGSKVGVHIV